MDIISDPTDPSFNCYVSYDEATVFIGDMLRAPNWKASGSTDHKRALLTATVLLDRYVRWYGTVADEDQPLGWPRTEVQRTDRPLGTYYPSDSVPDIIKYITVEYAEALLGEDLSSDQETGLSALRVGPITLNFSRIDRKDVMPDSVKLVAGHFGKVRTMNSGAVPVVRR